MNINKQDGKLLWISGYSSSGKTSVARLVEFKLRKKGYNIILIDGDDLRSIFSNRWGYERSDRIELGKVYFKLCNYLTSQGYIVILSAVAMFEDLRNWLKNNIQEIHEIYLSVPEAIRLERDSKYKNVYSKTNSFTELYEEPINCDLIIENSGDMTVEIAAEHIVDYFINAKPKSIPELGRKEFWNNYYLKEQKRITPSTFAIYVNNLILKPSKLLEVGCGYGNDAKFLSQMGHKVTAIDSSKNAITYSVSNKIDSSILFVNENFNDMAIEKNYNKFDIIYNKNFLNAITNKEEDDFLIFSSRLLNPNGKIFIECISTSDKLMRSGKLLSSNERILDRYIRFIDLNKFLVKLINLKYIITSAEEIEIEENENRFNLIRISAEFKQIVKNGIV
jgi:adenylylsulfate kinase-like enzyme/ubiquinone/menaquinone biosynthesis C-methylase UbiE